MGGGAGLGDDRLHTFGVKNHLPIAQRWGQAPFKPLGGSCLVLAVTLGALSLPLGRGNPSAPPGPAVAAGAGSEPTARAHQSCLLVDVKGPCETN